MKRLLLAFLTVFAATACPAQTTRPAFIVGVFQQPVESFATWKSRGINTLVNTISGPGQLVATPAEYVARAHAAGLWVIADCPEADAFNQRDEADGKGIEPSVTLAKYKSEKIAHSARLVFQNLDGRRCQWTDSSVYVGYGAACDWYGIDIYPYNTGDGSALVHLLGDGLDKLHAAAPTKSLFAVIECSDQQLGKSDWLTGTPQGLAARAPTVAEMQAEIVMAVVHGAKGIVYFPHVIGNGWIAFDGTTPEIAAAMPAINAALVKPSGPSVPAPATAPVDKFDGAVVTGNRDGTYTITPRKP